MNRRRFLSSLAGGAVGAALADAAPAGDVAAPRPSLLSTTGCGRATGYAETNKIVTVGDKTHVAWCDSVDDGFRIRMRTLDRSTGQWSPTYTVDKAYDNHGGPALTVDSKGYLHIVYYPHHHPFRYRRSTRPNDASAWDDAAQFGSRCTYPTLVVGPDDTLYLTCRESNKEGKPWVMNLYAKPVDNDWSGPRAIMVSPEPGYSHFQDALAWVPDHQILHLSTRMYGGKPGKAHTVGYMRSRNCGKTWERSDGAHLALPATRETIDVIASDRDGGKHSFRCGSIAVDASGKPAVLYSDAVLRPTETWLASPDGSGGWTRTPLLPHMAKVFPKWSIEMPGGLCIAADGKMFVTLTATPPRADGKPQHAGWGHPRDEIVWLESEDGGKSFSARLVCEVNPQCPHWLPNIERPTGHNRVLRPGLLYTAGTAGRNNKQIVSNRVCWVG